MREYAVNSWRDLYYRYSTSLSGPGRHISPLSWVGDERVAVGCMPTASTLYLLPEQGITHVVNCRSVMQTRISQDIAMERALFGASRVMHAPMWDFGRPQPPRLWAAAALFAAQALSTDPGAAVLIHCQKGRRRSVMVAYAVLRLRGHSPEQATALITRHRLEAVLVDSYTASVEAWLAADSRSVQ
jgi:protein-tyrosine phosphatase